MEVWKKILEMMNDDLFLYVFPWAKYRETTLYGERMKYPELDLSG